MLTIVTGTPGAGKTLHSLWRIYRDYREKASEGEQRPIFVNGVPGIDHSFFGSQELENPEKWYECPEGSIIFIDEAQRVFPQRPPSAPVPRKCREFETHRHRGLDIFLTTQDANTLDVHTRRLCGRHLHVRRTLGQEVSTVYEYDSYQKAPTDYFSKRDAISSAPWKFPKDFYERYKSATLHTVKKRYPLKLFIPFIGIAGVVFLAWLAMNSIGSSLSDVGDSNAAQVAGQLGNLESGQQLHQRDLFGNGNKQAPVVRQISTYTDLWSPVVPGVQHTAPVYQPLFIPKTFPKPYCILFQDKFKDDLGISCKCYTQQITTYETSDQNCRYWAEHGFFDPTLERPYESGQRAASAEARGPVAPG